MKKRTFIFSFGAGFLVAGVLYCLFLFYIIPLCNIEGWLNDVLLEKKEIAENTKMVEITKNCAIFTSCQRGGEYGDKVLGSVR